MDGVDGPGWRAALDGRRPPDADARARRALGMAAALGFGLSAMGFAAAAVSGSQALAAGALAPLGAALTGGLRLAGTGLPFSVRRSAGLAKGVILAGAGAVVLGSTLHALAGAGLPRADLMGGMALALLAAHLVGLLVLLAEGGGGSLRGAAAASRAGASGQALVAFAAAGVWLTGSDLPDLTAAAALATASLFASLQVLRQAWVEFQTGEDRGALASHGFKEDFA